MKQPNGEPVQEVSISNPILGTLAAKGVRVSDLIGLITLIAVTFLAFFIFKLSTTLETHIRDSSDIIKLIIDANNRNASAQRLMACILSKDQPRRESEFANINSFCHSMARGLQ